MSRHIIARSARRRAPRVAVPVVRVVGVVGVVTDTPSRIG